MNIIKPIAFNPLADDYMPVDRMGFVTNLPVKPDVTTADPHHIKNVRIPTPSASRAKQYEQQRTIPIVLSPNGAIRVLVVDLGDKGYWLRRVEFNPGRLIHCHNGQLLTTPEVVTALAIVCDKIQPLLANPEDAALLIPGCQKDSPSYWSVIEIDLHLHDPDDALLLTLRNVRHPAIRKKATVFEGESITLGSRRGDIMITFYRKDLQMARDLEKFGVEEPNKVLRVEVTLRGQKLLDYLGIMGNKAMIASHDARGKGTPQPRLVRFLAEQIVDAHKQIMAELRGISGVTVKGNLPANEKAGRMLGLVCRHTSAPVETLLDLYRLRFSPSPNTMSRMRSAAIDELSLATNTSESLFTDDRYLNQPVISIPQLEMAAMPNDYPSEFRAAIEANYGTQRKAGVTV